MLNFNIIRNSRHGYSDYHKCLIVIIHSNFTVQLYIPPSIKGKELKIILDNKLNTVQNNGIPKPFSDKARHI